MQKKWSLTPDITPIPKIVLSGATQPFKVWETLYIMILSFEASEHFYWNLF